MTDAVLPGLALILVGGMLNGSFALPMKFMPRWPWEAIWLVFSVSGLLVVPIVIALATIPDLLGTYALSSAKALVLTALFGLGWGLGAILFGVGISRLGMSLGFSIILGLGAALGSLVPMLVLAPGDIVSPKGFAILAGLAVVLLGIYLCGKASAMKAAPAGATAQTAQRNSRSGLVICILAGVLISMLNLSFAFGAEIAVHAVSQGATPVNAVNAIWVLALASGALVNVGYCATLLHRNATAAVLKAPGTGMHWLMGVLMGTLWMSGVAVYGSGAARLGSLGPVIGWPLLQATIIVTGNVLGWLTGEWRGATPTARRTMVGGLVSLTVAVFIIGYGSSLR